MNQRGVGTFPKEVPIPIETTAEAAWNDFSPGMTEKKSIPNSPNHDASEQSLIPFSNMWGMQELKGASNDQHRALPESLSPTQIKANLEPPSVPNGSFEMLLRPNQMMQNKQTRSIPTTVQRIPRKADNTNTLNQVNWSMSRTTTSNQAKQSEKPRNLQRSKARYQRKSPNPHQTKKNPGSQPGGPSNKDRTAQT